MSNKNRKNKKLANYEIEEVEQFQASRNKSFDLNSIKINFKYKTENQKKFVELIKAKEIVFGIGSAGVGKTFVALAQALMLVKDPTTPYKKIILIKSVTEAEESLGFLKGTLSEKLEPFIFSFFYALEKIIPKEVVEQLKKDKTIDVIAVSHLRGITIDEAIVIGDEFQNLSPLGVKTLLTRIGSNSKFILLGDLEQSDKFKDSTKSGLYDALNRFKGMSEIGFIQFKKEDCVRNPIITKILGKY